MLLSGKLAHIFYERFSFIGLGMYSCSSQMAVDRSIYADFTFSFTELCSKQAFSRLVFTVSNAITKYPIPPAPSKMRRKNKQAIK